MLSKLTPAMRRAIIATVFTVVVVLGVVQVNDALQRQRLAQQALREIRVAAGANTEERKTQQEAVEAWRQNREKTLFWSNLASPLNTSITVLLSLFGAIGTAIAFLEAREKERRDRRDAAEKDRVAREDALAKDREERHAAGFSEMLKLLVSAEVRERVVGASSLAFFLAPERAEYHQRAVGALVAALRSADTAEVRQGLRLAAEHAARTLDPTTLARLSWQGVYLRDADLSGCDLSSVDLRDADLQDARLVGTVLAGARLVNTQLQGADLAGADLRGAELVYADLAGASAVRAKFGGANLAHVRVLNLDLTEAEIDETTGE